MRFGNFVVVKHNGKIVCGKLGDCGIYLEYVGDANPIPVREVEPLFEIEVSRPFPEYFKVDDFRKFVISTLTQQATHPAVTLCDNCGCDWLDNGLNPVGCPYCKQSAEIEVLRAERDALAERLTAETSNTRTEAEYEYEVWQDGALQAGGRETDYASAKSEANHYAMMYAQDGPVEVRIYEKRLLTTQTQLRCRPYNSSGSLSEYGIFPECDSAPASQASGQAQAAIDAAMRKESRQ